MKIKEICEITGLTDKTVRFYIDNKLITPHCTENYLGRRSFTFSEDNIKELDDIATLRKAGFSVAQIKEIQDEKEKSIEIIAGIIAFKENQIKENKTINTALSQLKSDKAYTVREIAEVLREPARNVEPLLEDEDWVYLIIKWAKLLVAACMSIAPVVAYFIGFFFCFSDSGLGYGLLITPRDWPMTVLAWLAMLAPGGIFALSFLIKKARKVVQFSTAHNGAVLITLIIIAFTFFVFYLVVIGSAGSDFKKETYSLKDYYDTCNVGEEGFFPEIIPESALEQAESCEHRYSCICDYPVRYYYSNYGTFIEGSTGQRYAEWRLSQSELEKEIARIEASFGEGETHIYGDFTVKVYDYFNTYGVKSCTAFAYNESDGVVRYIIIDGFVNVGEYYCEKVHW